MKKFLSIVTALCCTASMMAVLPAQAEEITEDCFIPNIGYTQEPYSEILMHCYMQDGKPVAETVKHSEHKQYLQSMRDYTLQVRGSYHLESDGTSMKQLVLDENAGFITYPNLGGRYLEVTKTDFQDMTGTFELVDSMGNTYEYSQNFGEFQPTISLQYAKEGDIYLFKMYHDIPVSIMGTAPEPDCRPFMVITGEQNGRFFGRYYPTARTGLTSCDLVAEESKLMYLPEDYSSENVQYGDIFEVGDDYGFTDSNPSEIFWYDGGDVQKQGKAYIMFDTEDLEIVSRSEKNKILTLQLKNADGKEYTYLQDNSIADLNYGYQGEFKVGETVTFAVYGTTAFLPMEEDNSVPEFDPEKDSFFLVTSASDSPLMLKRFYQHGKFSELVMAYGNFSYGDVLVYDGDFSILESYPAQLAPNSKGLKKAGTVEDFFTTKELTITKTETFTNTEEDTITWKTFYLADINENAYRYYQDYSNVTYGISMKEAQIGDVYTFAFNGDYLLLPVAQQTASPVVKPVVTVKATGDADGNGGLDILDVITVNKAVLGKEALAEDKIALVDFNGNGVPDSDDALTMLKKIVGLA